jgi:hypothetical protein
VDDNKPAPPNVPSEANSVPSVASEAEAAKAAEDTPAEAKAAEAAEDTPAEAKAAEAAEDTLALTQAKAVLTAEYQQRPQSMSEMAAMAWEEIDGQRYLSCTYHVLIIYLSILIMSTRSVFSSFSVVFIQCPPNSPPPFMPSSFASSLPSPPSPQVHLRQEAATLARAPGRARV